MSELAFNELSMDTKVANVSHAGALFEALFEICDAVNKLKLGTFSLRIKKGVNLTAFQGHHLTIITYLESIDKENRTRYTTYLAQKPLLANNPYHKFKEKEAVGFGYAYETGTVSVSINNTVNWKENSYEISREFLPEGSDADIQTNKKNVMHLPFKDQLPDLLPVIHAGILKKAMLNLGDIISIEDFWEKRTELFTMLDFSTDAEALLHKLGSINHPDFIKAARYFERLNLHLLTVGLKQATFDDIPGDVSLDSGMTLTKYGSERIFSLPSGGTGKFSLHAKLGGNLRIYLWPEEGLGRITIGHVGHHLRTVKYK
ncbi:hypothetical protein [Pedobacter antarcticus]|uniref:hypothetical protein n=1 Tax=Pedobacter antarcticus TaxID=34086 RepID=UPI00292D5AEB|nr:hypothetical protein [Pedobacter antarcticus]